jgi:hypothetical protein
MISPEDDLLFPKFHLDPGIGGMVDGKREDLEGRPASGDNLRIFLIKFVFPATEQLKRCKHFPDTGRRNASTPAADTGMTQRKDIVSFSGWFW